MRKNKYMGYSHEDLVSTYGIIVAQEILYPKNKRYPQECVKIEKELIRRLGGDWSEFCRINDYTMDD